jgi:hypothetical protein
MKKTPLSMNMVQYWKTKESVAAKVTRDKDGALIMKMEGEKYDFPGFPRGHLLFGTLSKLKHEIKNQIFNDSWALLEKGVDRQWVIHNGKQAIDNIGELLGLYKYDMVPPEKMIGSVREIWRAWPEDGERSRIIKEVLTYILQEDDGYRFRLQWIIGIFNPSSWWFKLCFRDPIKDLEIALQELEHAEVIGDMKDKIKLFRRIVMLALEDEKVRNSFLKLCKNMNWNKLKLSEGDKYHFRGKYFKVDFEKFDY